MKTLYKILLPVLVMIAVKTTAQAPSAIPYQAVARDNAGNIIVNQIVSLRFSIHDASAVGTVVYKETHSATTNSLGLFTVNIGQGTVVTGTFSSINWGGGSKFIQVEIDASGGITYINMGTQQMLSVPYALYAAAFNETDPKISSSTIGKVPRWSGTNLVDGSIFDNASNIGIGTITPEFKLSLDNDGGIFAKGTFASGATLTTSGAGTRMFWYPKKSAFRVGNIDGTQWDNVNIGDYSFATGVNNIASGNYSTAMGFQNIANGLGSTVFGELNIASGTGSTAMGYNAVASGIHSTAIGSGLISSGDNSIAIGNGATSSGIVSFAIGNNATASGNFSVALGFFVSTNLQTGSFVLGDVSTATRLFSSTANEYSSRFAGGYRFFSNAAATPDSGMFLTGGKVGIGTATPEFKLSLDNDGGILSKGTLSSGATLTTAGAGLRMFWYPKKAAFRAGYVFGSQWDDVNIGIGSFATGNDTKASGNYSTAMGSQTTASGTNSTALGKSTIASGNNSTAMGNLNTASGDQSTVMGDNNIASGLYSTAMGSFVSTNNQLGSFAMGDFSTGTTMNSSIANEYSARFDGGYRFFSDVATSTANGMFLKSGKLGIGTAGPSAILSLCSTGIELGGTSASTTLRTNAGVLGTANGSTVKLASFGFTSSNNTSLGIMAYRNGFGTDYHSSVIVLGMDEDNLAQVGGAYLAISNNGNIGIGTAAPTQTLHVAGNGLFTGTVTASCGTLSCSDVRYKKSITPILHSLDKICLLSGVNYFWKKDEYPEMNFNDDKQIGVIAQELEKVFPELVHTDANGYKTVDYTKLTPVLIEAIKELKSENEKLKSENTSFKKNEEAMMRDISKIKTQIGMEEKAEK